MKYSDLERGPIDGRVEDFELPGGVVVKVRVLPLLPAADMDIADAARAFAEKRGVPAVAGNTIYELGVYAHTIFRSIRDPDDGAPFFASVEEMLEPKTDEQGRTLRGLDRDRIALLFELQQQAQADFAPRAGKLTNAEYYTMLDATAQWEGGAAAPFERLPRNAQRNFVHITCHGYCELARRNLDLAQEIARLRTQLQSVISSPPAKSSHGLDSPVGTTTSVSSASSSPHAPPECPPATPLPGEGHRL